MVRNQGSPSQGHSMRKVIRLHCRTDDHSSFSIQSGDLGPNSGLVYQATFVHK
jgi:hypothetical protein